MALCLKTGLKFAYVKIIKNSSCVLKLNSMINQLNSEKLKIIFKEALAELKKHNLSKACEFFNLYEELTFGRPWNLCSADQKKHFFDFPGQPPEALPLHKLVHDFEQISCLIESGKLPPDFSFIQTALAQVIQSLCGRFSRPDPTELLLLNQAEQTLLHPFWGKSLYKEPWLDVEHDLLNPDLDLALFQKAYHTRTPYFSCCDQFLSEQALAYLQDFIFYSTCWHDYHRGGYVGSYLPAGFFSPFLFKLSDEMRIKFPELLARHALELVWAYKYAATTPGVGIHADSQGRVNVNLWLTPDQANLNPENGGLVIYDVIAPEDWDPHKYRIQDILPPGPCQIFRIPYRANRVVFFDSRLFHASDAFSFRAGYLNRRTNVTFLFGRRVT
jgi:hypothetical protein